MDHAREPDDEHGRGAEPVVGAGTGHTTNENELAHPAQPVGKNGVYILRGYRRGRRLGWWAVGVGYASRRRARRFIGAPRYSARTDTASTFA